MSDSKISALTAVSTPAATDQFAVNQGGTSKMETLAQITSICAVSEKLVAAPAGPNSTSAYTMQGLAAAITPAVTGRIYVVISGYIATTTTAVADAIQYQITYGTGTAPSTNAAVTGTAAGSIQISQAGVVQTTAADQKVPFCTTAIITGLTLATAYWVDLRAEAVGATGYKFVNVTVDIIEL